LLTLCHGDTHVGNMFFVKTSGQMGFLDMQCVVADRGIRDVAYHLALSCDPDWLAAHESDFLRCYVDSLNAELLARDGAAAHTAISFDECFFWYRTYTAWALIAWVVCMAASDLITADMVVFGLNRVASTCQRLDTLGALRAMLKKE
jgi:hypothetical protein